MVLIVPKTSIILKMKIQRIFLPTLFTMGNSVHGKLAEKYKESEVLKLNNRKLKGIPEVVLALPASYRQILLQDNFLGQDNSQTLSQLSKFELVEYLNLASNSLVEIPPELCKLAHLSFLDLGKNKLSKLPEHFTKLQRLEHLILWENQIDSKTFKMLATMTTLRFLDIVSNR